LGVSFTAQSSCIIAAAQCFNVNPVLIQAIIWQESGNRQHAFNINKNKTVDVGVMQINSIHFESLKPYAIHEKDLKENSCVNVFSGTWILNKAVKQNGYTWEGIASYHSKTPLYRDRYITKIINTIRNDIQVIKNIYIPYQPGLREKFSC